MPEDLYAMNPASRLTPVGPPKRPGKAKGPWLSVAVVAGVLLFVFLVVRFVLPGRSAAAAQPAEMLGADARPGTEEELVTFAGKFLMNYYNYSAPLYQAAVQRAEDMMTPELQEHYQAHALDQDFIHLLQTDQVSTDGFRITPGSYLFAQDGKTHWLQLTGSMTYTTGVNGAQALWPMTVLLEIVETDQGFKVNNVKGLR
ncbi:MAG TPA: hypothetical protein VK914_07920 [bacterium]|jgi:hypothetical protein|nr:hypothetical protein [bacterium]